MMIFLIKAVLVVCMSEIELNCVIMLKRTVWIVWNGNVFDN